MKAIKKEEYTITLNRGEVDLLKSALALLAGETLNHPERFKNANELNDAAADLYGILYHVMKD